MATGDQLPRLADALREVGDRIHQISAELLTLDPRAGSVAGAATDLGGPGVWPGSLAPGEKPTAGSGAPQVWPGSMPPQTPTAGPVAEAATDLSAGPGAPIAGSGTASDIRPGPTSAAAGAMPDAGRSGGQGAAPTAGPVAKAATDLGAGPGAPIGPGTTAAGSGAAPISGAGAAPNPWPGPMPPAPGTPPGGRAWAGLPNWSQLPPPQLTPPTPSRWERTTRDGSRILAWLGGIVTLAGVALLLVLAIQRGYLGPLPRVLLGAGLGAGLAGIGARLHRNPHARTGAFALVATGFAVLCLDVVAATVLFEYLPVAAGLGLGLAVAALGLALAVRWNAQGLGVFVVLGAACAAPVVAGGFVPLLVGFLLVLQIGATPAQLTRRWGGLALAAALPPVLAALASVAAGPLSDAPAVAYLALLTSAAQVVIATVGALRQQADLRTVGLVLLSPAPAMVAATLLPQAGAIALPGTTGALLVLVWALGRLSGATLPPAFVNAAGAAGSVAFLEATVLAFDGTVLALVLLAQALLLALVARGMRYPHALAAACLFTLAGLGVAAASALPGAYVRTPPGRLATGTIVTAGMTGLLLAAAVLATCWVATHLGALTGDGARVGWPLGGLVALYGESGAVLSIGLLISPDRSGFLLGHVLVTVSWTAAALVLLLRGIDAVPLRVAGLSLVGAALVKLVLFDLSSLDGFARVAAFLVAGLLLLGAGTRYARLVSARAPEVTEGR